MVFFKSCGLKKTLEITLGFEEERFKTMVTKENQIRKIRIVLAVFVIGLVLSGLTAFPLLTEVRYTLSLCPDAQQPTPSFFTAWLLKVYDALLVVDKNYPFLPYGTDWLAFAHLVIAIAFIGPWRDPVKNIWVIDFGLIACAAVIPLAIIAGQFREIPFWWRLIDCSFGVFGAIPLIIVRRMITTLIKIKDN